MMVDFYGVQGFLFHPDRFPVRRTAMGDDVTHPDATAVLNVPKLAAAMTYRVWLVKRLQFRDESLDECKTLYHHGRGHFTPSACLVARHLAITSSVTPSVTVTRWCKGCTGRLFPSMSVVNLQICAAERWMGDCITIHFTPSEQGGVVSEPS